MIDIDRITQTDIAAAARNDDVNAAASALQEIAGIEDGGLASMWLDEDDWSSMDTAARETMLNAWLAAERRLVAMCG